MLAASQTAADEIGNPADLASGVSDLVRPAPSSLAGPIGTEELRGLMRLGLLVPDRCVRTVIRRRRRAADLGERSDILSLLLRTEDEEGRPLSDRELRDELMTGSPGHGPLEARFLRDPRRAPRGDQHPAGAPPRPRVVLRRRSG